MAKTIKKSVTYNKDFKIRAVKLYNGQGLTSTEIFRREGFDLNLIGKDKPKDCLRRWNKVYRAKGERGLTIETRGRAGGRPKKPRDKTEADKIKRLEAEIAYLKAENDFLAKLRAKRKAE